jgi:hypothetical protein
MVETAQLASGLNRGLERLIRCHWRERRRIREVFQRTATVQQCSSAAITFDAFNHFNLTSNLRSQELAVVGLIREFDRQQL